MKIRNRHFMKSKDVKTLQSELQRIYPNLSKLFGKNEQVEKGILEDGTTLYFINGKLTFFERENHILPFLKILLKNLIVLPKITVDMGAIPFIIKGADIMVPGIVATDENIKKGDYVVIIDEKHAKPLAIGTILMDKFELSKEKKGKFVKNLHFIGDRLWDFAKKFEDK